MTKEKNNLDIDFGIGKLSIGGLFKGIEKFIDLAAELKETGGEIRKEGEIDLSHLKEDMKGVYGFSIKTAVGGKPIFETFGNIKKTPEGTIVEEEREPLSDIFDEKEEILVIVEIPGVQEEGITIDFKNSVLKNLTKLFSCFYFYLIRLNINKLYITI